MIGDALAIKIFEGGNDAEILMDIAALIEKPITIQRAGKDSAGDVVKIGDKKTILSPRLNNNQPDQVQGPWEMTYAIGDDGRISWVWIGHKLIGPCYQLGADEKWRNCFSHGNFGKNISSGGTWSGGHNTYQSLDDCIKNRQLDAISFKISDACIPVTQPKLAARRFMMRNDDGTVTVENETLRITLPESEYKPWSRDIFGRVMESLANQSEVTLCKKEGIDESSGFSLADEIRYRKIKAKLPASWKIEIIGTMPNQVGLCRYVPSKKRDNKGRFCK